MIISITIRMGGVIVIRLVIDFEELVKVALRKGWWKKEWVCGLRVNGDCSVL
jgi:hypothetical protein